MRSRVVHIGAIVVGLVAAAGCSVGQGSPDGWRYMTTGAVEVAHPKTWRETRDGAVLHGGHGRTDAAFSVTAGGGAGNAETVPAGGNPKTAARKAETLDQPAGVPAPGYVRREALRIDGRPAQILSYAQPAADGRPAGHIEVRTTDPRGHSVLIRAWAVDGTADDPSLLREIVNSIEFAPQR